MTTAPRPIRIVIADDHPLFRDALRAMLHSEPDFRVVGVSGDGIEAVRLATELKPDILLLDVDMPRLPGLEALRALEGSCTPVHTLLLTGGIRKSDVVKALRFGARGVVLKDTSIELLFKSIRAVAAGHYWIGREDVADLVRALRDAAASAGSFTVSRFRLTTREFEIIAAVESGASNKEIAQQLHINEATVKYHLTRIFQKVGVANRLELALFAAQHNLTAD